MGWELPGGLEGPPEQGRWREAWGGVRCYQNPCLT